MGLFLNSIGLTKTMSLIEYKYISNDTVNILRFIYTILNLKANVYGKTHFYVSENLYTHNNESIVILPKLNKLFSEADYKYLKKLDIDYLITNYPYVNIDFKDERILNIQKTIENYSISQKSLDKFRTEWDKVKCDFQTTFNNIFNIKLEEQVTSVNILVSKIGSVGSYAKLQNKTLNIFIREDTNVCIIAELIITSLISIITNKDYINSMVRSADFLKTYSWYINESISDFLLTNTSFANLFPNFKPTIPNTLIKFNRAESDRLKISNEYLKYLGLKQNHPLSIEGDSILNNQDNKKPITGFTVQEKKLLFEFVKNANKELGYDSIAKTLWGNDYVNYFSMGAINKIIFSIRMKLKMHSLINCTIENTRTKGYILRM